MMVCGMCASSVIGASSIKQASTTIAGLHMTDVKDAIKFLLQLRGKMRIFKTPAPTTSVQSVS